MYQFNCISDINGRTITRSLVVTKTTSDDASFGIGLNADRVIILNTYCTDSDSGIEANLVGVRDKSYFVRFENKLDGYIKNKELTVHIDYILR